VPGVGSPGSALIVPAAVWQTLSSMCRQLKPRGACGKHSPSCTYSTFPVGEPKTFSSSKCLVIGARVPGGVPSGQPYAAIAHLVNAAVDLRPRASPPNLWTVPERSPHSTECPRACAAWRCGWRARMLGGGSSGPLARHVAVRQQKAAGPRHFVAAHHHPAHGLAAGSAVAGSGQP
jgi:hypothetical protein